MEHIITPTEVKSLGRPIGQVDENQLASFITETEQMYVKPVLGDALFLNILSDEGDTYKTLLDGGTYGEGDNQRSFVGLRVTMSYYVYAQNIMTGDFQSTRFGMVIKQNDYSNPLTGKERSDAYNNALQVANRYLADCVAYCKAQGFIHSRGRAYGTGSVTIRKIG